MRTKTGSARLLPAAALMTALALSAACSTSPDEEAPELVQGAGAESGYTPKTVRFTEGNNGKTAKLYAGDTFVITLSENPSTGHSWDYDSRPTRSVLRQTSDRYEAPSSSGGEPKTGAPGKHIWEFRAAGKGNTSLQLGYYPPQDGAEAVEEYSVQVKVSDPPSAREPKTVRFDARHDGATANLVVGDTLRLTLEENQSTGHKWEITRGPSRSIARKIDERYAKPASGSSPGTPGKRVWNFRATGQGSTWVYLELTPADDSDAADEYRVRIKVTR